MKICCFKEKLISDFVKMLIINKTVLYLFGIHAFKGYFYCFFDAFVKMIFQDCQIPKLFFIYPAKKEKIIFLCVSH